MEQTFGEQLLGKGLLDLLKQVDEKFPPVDNMKHSITLQGDAIMVSVWVKIDGYVKSFYLGIEESDYSSTTSELLDQLAKYIETQK